MKWETRTESHELVAKEAQLIRERMGRDLSLEEISRLLREAGIAEELIRAWEEEQDYGSLDH